MTLDIDTDECRFSELWKTVFWIYLICGDFSCQRSTCGVVDASCTTMYTRSSLDNPDLRYGRARRYTRWRSIRSMCSLTTRWGSAMWTMRTEKVTSWRRLSWEVSSTKQRIIRLRELFVWFHLHVQATTVFLGVVCICFVKRGPREFILTIHS